MKYNLAASPDTQVDRWEGPGPIPEFGPSPGFTDLKWLKPVYAGETVTFTRTALAHRPIGSRPGWRLLSIRAEAFDSTGDKVIEFESAVLVRSADRKPQASDGEGIKTASMPFKRDQRPDWHIQRF